MKIILASKSPRRKELLELMGVKNFEIINSNIDEKMYNNLNLEEMSKRLAYEKAKAVFNTTTGDRIVIGSDTLVIKDGKTYGKPKNEQEAFEMIKELQGNVHKVYTSLCVLKEENGKYTEYVDLDISTVEIKEMLDSEIKKWINTGKALDKAGAYSAQESFAVFVSKVEGQFQSIIGLPISKLYDVIKDYI